MMIIRTRCKHPRSKTIVPRQTLLASPFKWVHCKRWPDRHSCISEALQRLGRRRGSQKGRDVQIHFSITQLTAPWENKSKKCATLKCVHAARDIFNVNPVFLFSKSLIIWLHCRKGYNWSSQNKLKGLILFPSPCRNAEYSIAATPTWQCTTAYTLHA